MIGNEKKQYKVGILGCTGMVGQRFVSLLMGHPWFEVSILAASPRSAEKTYEEALNGRWGLPVPCPEEVKNLRVLDVTADAEKIVSEVDFVFCAIDMKKPELSALEERYALLECPVVSNNSAHRTTSDVPMIIPEVNPHHAEVIPSQRKRLGTARGFIAVKSNCSLQCYVPAIHPLMSFGPERLLVCTYQAISGAGKTFERWPEMHDNIIPFIAGEEEKSECEPAKIWGKVESGEIAPTASPKITAQCLRVPVTDGHTAAVFASFSKKPSLLEVEDRWKNFKSEIDALKLPSSPNKFLEYIPDPQQLQIKSARSSDGGMAVSVGRLREDSQYDIKFICMSHNTIRGAAGGAILLAELLCARGYI